MEKVEVGPAAQTAGPPIPGHDASGYPETESALSETPS